MTKQGAMTLGSRLRKARDVAGLTQRALAEIVGIRQQAIQRIESGEAKTTSYIVPLAKALHITPEWLALGEGQPAATLMVHEDQQPYLIEKIFSAPLLSWSEVSLVFKLPLYFTSDERYSVAVNAPLHKQYFALRVEDDSMAGRFEVNDYIVVDPTLKPRAGSVVVAAYKKSMLLRNYIKEKGRFSLKAENEKYPTIPVDAETSILGVVAVRYTDFP